MTFPKTKTLKDNFFSSSENRVCPRGVSRGGGSDANILNEKGLTTNLGLGMKEEHTYKEKIAINDLVKGGELVLAIVQSLAKLTDE